MPGEAVPASSIKNYGGLKKLGASTPEGRMQTMVSGLLFRHGVRKFSVEIGKSDRSDDHFAIVSFENGNKAPPEKIITHHSSFLEYGTPNISLSKEFIALCVLLQP